MNDYIRLRNELKHHGIKGQKWGVRRYQNEDGTLTDEGKEKYGEKSQIYTKEQYNRDKEVYGKSAANRINEKSLKGEQISGSRSHEADRIASYRKGAKIVGEIGSALGTFAGVYTGYKISKKIGSTGNLTGDYAISAALVSGGATIGNILGKIGGQTFTMALGGYSPKKAK